jgi:hypothetical protein
MQGKNILTNFMIGICFLTFCFMVLVIAQFALRPALKQNTISFPDLSDENSKYAAMAVIISIPNNGDNSPNKAIIGDTAILLRKGDAAYLQITTLYDRASVNIQNEYVSDEAIVSITPYKGGVKITALKAGEASVHAVKEGKLTPVAVVVVIDDEK